MPRSLDEWRNAYNEWRQNREELLGSIPPLDGDYVLYKRWSTNPYWSKRWEDVYNRIPSRFNFSFRTPLIEKFIRQAAEYEHLKETDFLSKFYKDGKQGESEIDMFNNLLQSRELYKKFNERIKNILTTKQFQENKDQSTHKYYTGMAPNLSSVFAGYLKDSLEIELRDWWSSFDASKPITVLASEFNTRLERATIAASERMAAISEERANEYGSGEEWKPVLEMLKDTTDTRGKNLFMDNLREAIGVNNIQRVIEDMVMRKTTKGKRAAVKTHLNKYLHLNQKARIGGSVLEPVIAALAKATNGAGNKDFNFSAENFGGNMRMTDVMMLFSTNLDLDLDSMIQDLNLTTSRGTSTEIREVYRRIQDWYARQNWDNDLKELYAVYVNAKNYGIGADGRDYEKTYSGPMDELPQFLRSTGMDISSVSDFLSFVYNTADGAINENQQFATWRYCVNALKAAAAKIMFDDYDTIGATNDHSIHLYYLSGKYLPSSYVLKAMADAAAEQNINSNAKVAMPDAIKDRGPKWSNLHKEGENDYDFKSRLREYWDEEYRRISDSSNWSVSFTLKIKDLLSGSF